MQELLIILAIVFLIFGGKKLPEIGSGLGKAITSFKKGVKEVEEDEPKKEEQIKSESDSEANKPKE